MSEFRNKEYIESMSLIKLSDEKKEKMISDLTKISPIRKEGTMKKRLGVKKTAIIVAACIMVFGVTAGAAGVATSIVSWNRIDTRTSNFEDLSKIEEKAGMDIAAIESFSNGYTFKHMEVEEAKTQDAEGNDLRHFKGIDLTYIKEGCPDIYIGMNPAEMFSGSYDSDTAAKEIDGVTVHYNYDEYLNLPDGERPTEEELQRAETDKHFYISDGGSDPRYTSYVSTASFEIDGIIYCILGFDLDMTADELFDMAEEIITAR